MKHKANFLSIVTLFVFVSSLSARRRPPQNQPQCLPDAKQVSELVETLAGKLKLNAVQKSKITELFEEHFKTARILMDQDRNQREQHHQVLDMLKNAFEAKVKAHLNETQQAEFDPFIKHRTPKHLGPPPAKH